MAKQYFPAFLDLEDQSCVVIGGGTIATDKIHNLLQAGAAVTVITPKASPQIAAWDRDGVLRLLGREYRNGDLEGARLVIAATAEAAVNRQVYKEGIERHLLINVVDAPTQCNYITPSVIRRGRLLLAISTQGIAPALAAVIRRYLERQFDTRVSDFLEHAAVWRNRLKREEPSVAVRRERWRRLIGKAAPILLGSGPPLADPAEFFRPSAAQGGGKPPQSDRRTKPIYLGSVGFDLLTGHIADLEACQAALSRPEQISKQLSRLRHRSGKPLLDAWVVVAEREFAEVYYQTSHARLARRALYAHFEGLLSQGRLQSHPMSYSGVQAINHLFRVASGLRSAVPLETEVHGVLRQAVVKSDTNQTLSFPLEQAFRAALALATRLRDNVPRPETAPESIHALLKLAATHIPRFGACCFAIVMELPWARAVQRMLMSQGVVTSRILLYDSDQESGLLKNLHLASVIKAQSTPLYLVLIVDGSKGTPTLSPGRVRALLNAGVAWLWVLDSGIPRVVPATATALRGVTVWDLTDLIDRHAESSVHDAQMVSLREHISQAAQTYHDRYLARPKLN